MRVVFCGQGHFTSAYNYTKAELRALDDEIKVDEVSRKELGTEVVDADVLVPLMSKLDADLLGQCKQLKLINQFGVGLEGVDIQTATSMGVPVCMIPSDGCGNAQSCAEQCLLLCLYLLRRMPSLQNSVRTGKLGVPTTGTLYKSEVLIHGLGGIGVQLALRLHNFGCSAIRAITRTGKMSYADKEGAYKTEDEMAIEKMIEEGKLELGNGEDFLRRFASTTSVVFLCVTQNPDTMELVNDKYIRALRRGAIIINVARGGIVNYDDIVTALDDGHLSGFGTDVFKHEPFPHPPIPDMDGSETEDVDPLWDKHKAFLEHEKVVATPHVAGVTEVSYRAMAKLLAENILKLKKGEALNDKVN